MRSIKGFSARVVSVAVASAISAAAGAQESGDLTEVVITGSRITTSGFTTPTPVTTFGAEQIEQLNVTNIGQAVNTLPAFRATTNPTTNSFGSFNVGAQLVNLRGLGVTRNLVLVDGRRFAPVTREGTVDLNLIPAGLVERSDVVTGGASAAYGSDAIAGVVNIILNKNLTGIKAQLDYGISDMSDGVDYHVSIAGGDSVFGGRGHFILGGEYDKQEGIGDCISRGSCIGGVTVTNSPGPFYVAGLPNFVRYPAGGGLYASTNGVISALNNNTASTAAIRNLFGTGAVTFDANGTPMADRIVLPGSANSLVAGGTDVYPGMAMSPLLVPTERYTAYGHMDYDFTEKLRGFVEGSYGHVEGSTLQSRYFGPPITIFNDNPYIPAQIRALLPPASATPGERPLAPAAVTAATAFNLAVLGQRRGFSSSEAKTYRFTAGLNGPISGSWKWDAYYQYADTNRFQFVNDALVTGALRVIGRPGGSGVNDPNSLAYFPWATDAVYNPADAALPAAQRRIVCRATVSADPALRAAAAGCVPFNPFGANSTSAAALDYVYADQTEDINIKQHVVAANVQGELIDLWAGPLSVATGAEYRRDTTSVGHDVLANSFAYFQNFGADYRGDQDVVEGYVEAELPLLKDLPFAQNLSLNAAGRRTHYKTSGFGSFNQAASENTFDTTSWKIGAIWDPVDWLRFRATQSRDIRAPNFNDLFAAGASNFTTVTNPFAGNTSQNPSLYGGGNPELNPEKGNTTTVGMVLQPHWGWSEGLHLSFDYYTIKVDDYIATPGALQNVVNRCFQFNDLCDLITFGPGNATITELKNVNVNLQWLRTKGLDIEAAYRLPMGLSFRLLATRTFENATNLFGTVTDRVGETGGGGSADWLTNLYTTYARGPGSVTLSIRYISDGIFNALYTGPDSPNYNVTAVNSVNDNTVASAVYLNLNGSYTIVDQDKRRIQLFGSINNLADRSPPSAPQLAYPTNPTYFDQIGRTYRAGVRLTF